MEIANGTGQHNVERKKENRKKIIAWFENNPGKTQKECSAAIGLSCNTIALHLKEIRAQKA